MHVDEREQIKCLKEEVTSVTLKIAQLKARLKQEEATVQLLQEELNLQDTSDNMQLVDKLSKADQLLTLMNSTFRLNRELFDTTAKKSQMEHRIEIIRNCMDEKILRSICTQQLPVTLSELFLGEELMVVTNSPRTLEQYPTAYCIQLHKCIPAATSVVVVDRQSKLQSQLTELIPEAPTYPPGIELFACVYYNEWYINCVTSIVLFS